MNKSIVQLLLLSLLGILVAGVVKPRKNAMILVAGSAESMLVEVEASLLKKAYQPEWVWSPARLEVELDLSDRGNCFLYIVGPSNSLGIQFANRTLTPKDLTAMLRKYCLLSTVVVSACNSGIFVDEMAHQKGMIVIASNTESSPMCRDGALNTIFDVCFIKTMNDWRTFTWGESFLRTSKCVWDEEKIQNRPHTLPTAWFGMPPTRTLPWR